MRKVVFLAILMLAGCAHQDLKAPYEEGMHSPVLDQWAHDQSEKDSRGRSEL